MACTLHRGLDSQFALARFAFHCPCCCIPFFPVFHWEVLPLDLLPTMFSYTTHIQGTISAIQATYPYALTFLHKNLFEIRQWHPLNSRTIIRVIYVEAHGTPMNALFFQGITRDTKNPLPTWRWQRRPRLLRLWSQGRTRSDSLHTELSLSSQCGQWSLVSRFDHPKSDG